MRIKVQSAPGNCQGFLDTRNRITADRFKPSKFWTEFDWSAIPETDYTPAPLPESPEVQTIRASHARTRNMLTLMHGITIATQMEVEGV